MKREAPTEDEIRGVAELEAAADLVHFTSGLDVAIVVYGRRLDRPAVIGRYASPEGLESLLKRGLALLQAEVEEG